MKYVTVTGLIIDLSDKFVNQYKNQPEKCPICLADKSNPCPLGHPYNPPKRIIPPPNPNEWEEVPEDNAFRSLGIPLKEYNGKFYRRKDSQKLVQIRLELKKLGLTENDISDVYETLDRRVKESQQRQKR